MNIKILDRLCCPVCEGKLDLRPFAEESIGYRQRESISDDGKGSEQENTERLVEDGVLLCPG